MLALGLLLNVAGIGLFCWLIFTLAVYALPFFVAVSVGMMALHSGAGRTACRHCCWRDDACGRSSCLCNDTVYDLARHHCGRFRCAGFTCRLSCRSRPVTGWGAFACLARGFRLPRRGLHRQYGVGAVDRLYGAPPNRAGGSLIG